MVPVQRFKRESHSDKGHALSTALAVHYALGCTMYNRWYDKVMRRQEPNYMYNNRSVTVVGDEITMQTLTLHAI